MPALLLWPVLCGQVPIFVEAPAGNCPAPQRVEERVRHILGLGPEAALEERATIERDGEVLRIVVRRADGSVLGERELSADAGCEELEALASVVVASWISDIHPEFIGRTPPLSAAGAMPDEPQGGTAPVSAPAQPTPAGAPLAPSPPKKDQPRPPRAAVESPERRRWQLGVATGADVSGGTIAFLGAAGVRWLPERWGLGLAAGALATTPRTEALSKGSVRYFRWPVIAGPVLRLPLGRFRLDVHGGPALGWLHAQGQGFAPSLTRNVLRGGGALGMRGGYEDGRLGWFLELSGLGWGKTEVFVERTDESSAISLPALELYAALGVRWTP